MNQDVKARLNGFSLEVRDRFKTGAVPSQDDFKLLIDYIHTLHQLLGLETADGAPGSGPGAGLKVVGGKVAVDTAVTNPTAGQGISVEGRKVSVDAGAGLTFSGNKLVVNTAEVYPTAGKGTTANGRAVSVDAGAGLTFSGNKLVVNTAEVYPTAGKGTTANGRAVSVDAGAGLTFSGNKLVVDTAVTNPTAGSGIHVAGKTVSLRDDSWIKLLGNLHGANYYCSNDHLRCFFSQQSENVVARFYYYGSGKINNALSHFQLNGVNAAQLSIETSTMVFPGSLFEGVIFKSRCYRYKGDQNMPFVESVPLRKI
ncbi:hypothetical protein [Pseudomonas sp. 210_17 TE3656]